MDLNQSNWYLQVKFSGIRDTTDARGSVKELLQQMLVALRSESPRAIDGVKTITLTLSSHPLKNRETFSVVDELDSFLATLDDVQQVSLPEPADDVQAWIDDSQAAQLRRILASPEAFNSVTPQEYESLRLHVINNFDPRFWQGLRWPKAQ